VIAEGRQHQTIFNLVTVLRDNPSHEAPEFSSSFVSHTQCKDYARKRGDVFTLQAACADLWGTSTSDAAKTGKRARIILARAVDISDDGL